MSELNTEEDKDLAARGKKEEPKLCPLILRFNIEKGFEKVEAHYCLKDKCALWVKGSKQAPNPFYYLVYEGCGLISNVFWETRKRDDV